MSKSDGSIPLNKNIKEPSFLCNKPKDGCGIVGVISKASVAYDIKYSLRVLQHRGQESAGIAVFNKGIKCCKGMGLVYEAISNEQMVTLKGNVGIGHVRYSTTGSSTFENSQPVVVKTDVGEIALAHNGEIVNADALRKGLQKKGWAFATTTDSEIIIRLLANEISTTGDVIKAIKSLMSKLVGSYSLVVLIGDRLIAVRDPFAFKPLCIGKFKNGYMVSSESVVFDTLGGSFMRDLKPGEIVELMGDSIRPTMTSSPKNHAHCMFEWVYFARPDSVIEGRLVYDVRREIGKTLAKEHPVEADVVIPVPDSGRAHALGYYEGSGIPYGEGLMKNRYIERTFIMPQQEDRETSVVLKLNPIKSVVDNKRVVLADDSIVRGTTMRKIVQLLRNAGAKEVHVRIGSPPIRAPCYFGIDMKTRDQFAATDRTVDQIAELITADTLGYISLEGLIKAIGCPSKDLCMGCLTGEYPIRIPGEKVRFQKQIDVF